MPHVAKPPSCSRITCVSPCQIHIRWRYASVYWAGHIKAFSIRGLVRPYSPRFQPLKATSGFRAAGQGETMSSLSFGVLCSAMRLPSGDRSQLDGRKGCCSG